MLPLTDQPLVDGFDPDEALAFWTSFDPDTPLPIIIIPATLTANERRVLYAVIHLTQRCQAPTVRELARETGLNTTTVRQHVRALQRYGLVDYQAMPGGRNPARVELILLDRRVA